ncbi:MAG: mandelate racemase/muconate lactonizing enzyme family protein, partial [Myxococcaceae bacterium]
MRLLRLEVAPLALRLRAPLRTARQVYLRREGFRLVLADEAGRRGAGEAMPLVELGTEPLAETASALEAGFLALKGAPLPSTPAQVEALLGGVAALARAPAARHGLELALLDLASTAAGQSLACFLAGSFARGEVRVSALLEAQEPAALERQARAAAAAGFTAVKVKVAAGTLEEDLERLRAVRAGAGDGVRLRIDANGGWSEDEAAAALGRLAPLGLELCEQPVEATDVAGLRRLRRKALCPIAADEALGIAGAREALLDGPA